MLFIDLCVAGKSIDHDLKYVMPMQPSIYHTDTTAYNKRRDNTSERMNERHMYI